MPIDRRPEFFKGAQLKVGIIGCGYVGLPLALRFAEAGHKVTGFDTDPDKVSMLNSGRSYIQHIPQNNASITWDDAASRSPKHARKPAYRQGGRAIRECAFRRKHIRR